MFLGLWRGAVKALYRGLQRRWVKPLALRFFFKPGRFKGQGDGRSNELGTRLALWEPQHPQPQLRKEGVRRLWFHAASVGELESLRPILEALVVAQPTVELILSIFSPSAAAPLRQLQETLQQAHARLLFVGYAPWEGEWQAALRSFQPEGFVTVRYEAWPDLWMSLQEEKIFLAIVCASARPSLRWAARCCQALNRQLPSLELLLASPQDAGPLKALFADFLPVPGVLSVGDPRWDRALARAQQPNPRMLELASRFQHLPKPWGVLGSVWPEDLQKLEGHWSEFPGTLWLVPHSLTSPDLARLLDQLRQGGLAPLFTAALEPQPESASGAAELSVQVVLVNEMGFLLELYALADWVYVGGGWGQGIHSVLEPAIYGVPIAVGPKRAALFSEVALIRQWGQLRVLQEGAPGQELLAWVREQNTQDKRSLWQSLAQGQQGATHKVLDFLDSKLKGLEQQVTRQKKKED